MRQLFILLTFLCLASSASADRVALVIGNATYAHASPLPNPPNDARAIADKLRALGFDVDLHEDLTGQQFRMALGGFTEKALRSDLALVYYAGHAIEMSGRNFLIPVDARMESESTAQFEAISLDDVLSSVRETGKLGMVLLDSCRDNPFANSMRRLNSSRAVSRGLAPVSISQESGILISFAAESGRTADDGSGEHSPYTQALLEVLDEPGLEVGRMFRKVRSKVRDTTNGAQVPVERAQLPDEAIYLNPARPNAPGPAPRVAVASPPPSITEDPLLVYIAAVQSGQKAALEDFLRRYPTHAKAPDARNLLMDIADREFWAMTQQQDTESAYSTYLLAFASGKYVAEAEQRLKELQTPPPPPPVIPDPVTQTPQYRQCPAQDGFWSVSGIRSNDTLFVRSGPGTNYGEVGELPYNADGLSDVACQSSGWCQVTYGCISGWSFGKYLKNRNGEHQTSSFAGYYAVSNHPMDELLNVRAGPGTQYAVVAELPPTAQDVLVSDCQVEDNYRYRWCALSWQDISGWAYGRYLINARGQYPVPDMPAAAVSSGGTTCEKLWIERNAIFDAKGYCFTTEKGQRYFDNSDCTTSSPVLSVREKARVESLRAQEKALGC